MVQFIEAKKPDAKASEIGTLVALQGHARSGLKAQTDEFFA